MSSNPVVLFAGGGTGGHIFPNVAILERLSGLIPGVAGHFLVSSRPLDGQVLTPLGVGVTGLPAQPLAINPLRWIKFARGWRQSVTQVRRLIEETRPAALIATGGFVSGPAVTAANASGLPVGLVNLDAVPGKANRMMASRADRIWSVYLWPGQAGVQLIGLPLRRCALGPADQAQARRELGLDPQRDTLFVVGGSQGAQTIDQAMAALLQMRESRELLARGQVLHVVGPKQVEAVTAAYQRAGVTAKVVSFCQEIGLAWRAATVAISRSGANGVAEAWANATPTIFLPYPFHKDQHQRLNALPLVQRGAAVLVEDKVEPQATATLLARELQRLLGDAEKRRAIEQQLRATPPEDGAQTVAQWLAERIGGVS